MNHEAGCYTGRVVRCLHEREVKEGGCRIENGEQDDGSDQAPRITFGDPPTHNHRAIESDYTFDCESEQQILRKCLVLEVPEESKLAVEV